MHAFIKWSTVVENEISKKGYSMEKFIVKRIIEIHDDIIKEYGGTYGLLTQGTLELLVYKVNREKDVFKQAALILQTIAAQHPGIKGLHLQQRKTFLEILDTICMQMMTKLSI